MPGEVIEAEQIAMLKKLKPHMGDDVLVANELDRPISSASTLEEGGVSDILSLKGLSPAEKEITSEELSEHSQYFLSIMNLARIEMMSKGSSLRTCDFLLCLSKKVERTLNTVGLVGFLTKYARLELMREYEKLSLIEDAYEYFSILEQYGYMEKRERELLDYIRKIKERRFKLESQLGFEMMYQAMEASRDRRALEMDLSEMGMEEDLSKSSPLFISILKESLAIMPWGMIDVNKMYNMDSNYVLTPFVDRICYVLLDLIENGIDEEPLLDFTKLMLLTEFSRLEAVKKVIDDYSRSEGGNEGINSDLINSIQLLLNLKYYIEMDILN